MRSSRSLSRPRWPVVFGWVVATAFASAWAHEGHDHGADAGAAAATPGHPGSPRASAQSPDFEAVAVLDGARLVIYIDRYATNEPLAQATVEIESEALKADASRLSAGVYAVAAPELTRPGRHALTLVVQAGDTSDLLNLNLEVPTPPAAPPVAAPMRATIAWAVAAAVLLLAGGVALAARRRPRSPAAGAVAVFVLLCASGLGAAGDALAHGGEDHRHDDRKADAAVSAAPDAAAAFVIPASPRRLPDGSVFMPKAVQYQLGIRHLVAEPGEHPATIEFSGRVIADPNASGRVQSTQAGRVEVGPQGLPSLGQRVAKGQVLALLRPSTAAIERGNQQAARAELEAQRTIAEQRSRRLEQLEGAVPQKEIEAARVEVASLGRRIEAIGGALAAVEPLAAPVAGVISAVHVTAGQLIDARETVIEIVDPARFAIEALAYEPVLPGDLSAASAAVGGRDVPLRFVGAGRQLREQAMPLLFALQGGDAVLAVGQPVKVIARSARRTAGVALPRSALVRLANGEPGVWVHAGAERFAPRRVTARPLDGATLVITTGVEKGERVVTEGASLIAQVR